MSDNLETNNVDQSTISEPTISASVNPASINPESVSTPNSVPENNTGLTSFTPEEVAVPTPAPTTTEPVSPIENLAKKEVVTRPLLWGVVVFLISFSFVIGAVTVYRYYQDQNEPVQDAVILPATTPVITTPAATTQSSIDATPVSTDTKVQADAISAEVQSIDTDIEGDVLSDSSLGL
jgi:hypothetical protein